jgi:hypothetical protein
MTTYIIMSPVLSAIDMLPGDMVEHSCNYERKETMYTSA